MNTPAIISWVIVNLLWASLLLSWYHMDSLGDNLRIGVEIAMVVVAWWSIPNIQTFFRTIMVGERFWKWGKTRFCSRSHMQQWQNRVGQAAFNTVIRIDEEVRRNNDVLRMMRL